MAKRKMTRMDKYAETRIWNLKIQNRNMTTQSLVAEMILRFRIEEPVPLDHLKKIILSARRRVMRRRTQMKKNIETWASRLFLPESIIAEWAWEGLLTEKNFPAVFQILARYRNWLQA